MDISKRMKKRKETHHFMHIKWRKEYEKGSLNLKNLPKHGGKQESEIAEWR